MAGIPVTVRKWLMDLGFDRRYGVRHAAGEEGGRRSQARDPPPAGNVLPIYSRLWS